MQCILVFDQLNDILYSKCNKKFIRHALSVAKTQGLVPNDDRHDSDLTQLTSDVVIQLFSPIITSQRLMTCQFGNSYTSIQCDNSVNLVFNEYMGYLFVYIGALPVEKLNRQLGICISLVKHLCGPDIPLLKSNIERSCLLSALMDTWLYLRETDQAVLVEAVEQLLVNNDLSVTTLKTLQSAVNKIQQQTEFSKIHSLLLVGNKFVSLYSSRTAEDLIPADIMFFGLLAEYLGSAETISKSNDQEDSDNLLCYSLFNSNSDSTHYSESKCSKKQNFQTVIEGMYSLIVLLNENRPYVVHIGRLDENVYLFLVLECGNSSVSTGLNDAFSALNALQSMQVQKDIEGVRHAFDFLDAGMKKIFDGARKFKNSKPIDMCHKNLNSKWGFLRKKYAEFIKNPDSECIVQIESSTSRFLDCLKLLLELTCLEETILFENRSVIESVFLTVKNHLRDFSQFLQVKVLRNFTLTSRASLTINKYLEEFPGLVHFIYIDRHQHRLTAPTLDFTHEETAVLTRKQLWSMVDYSRSQLQEGHLSMMWKDTTFNYAYFLWFEKPSGSPLKPKIYPTAVVKNFPPPGIFIEDFYRRLIEACFPKISPRDVRCYELFCIHLGLATSSCVLEHSRRLAATIWEVTGLPVNPVDFL
ncbi:hypothetical protein RUM44_011247 [Polyplax serrata]|uniref:Hermansky-Pudlak syndrome 1 protein homolog n=1 Tax=Polyplax serrata TaxID=468196 RepID=A0ABR1AR90_POLSC